MTFLPLEILQAQKGRNFWSCGGRLWNLIMWIFVLIEFFHSVCIITVVSNHVVVECVKRLDLRLCLVLWDVSIAMLSTSRHVPWSDRHTVNLFIPKAIAQANSEVQQSLHDREQLDVHKFRQWPTFASLSMIKYSHYECSHCLKFFLPIYGTCTCMTSTFCGVRWKIKG